MAKKSAKKRATFEEEFETFCQEDLTEAKVTPNLEPIQELIWIYCAQCRGNSKAWAHKRPLTCHVCGHQLHRKN